MATINIFDFERNRYDTGLTTDGVEMIRVQVLSGDEVLFIKYKDMDKPIRIDSAEKSGNWRNMSYYDGEYEVLPEEIEKWLTREGSVWGWPVYPDNDDEDEKEEEQ